MVLWRLGTFCGPQISAAEARLYRPITSSGRRAAHDGDGELLLLSHRYAVMQNT